MTPTSPIFLSAALVVAGLSSIRSAPAQAEPGVLRGMAVNKAFSAYPGQHHVYADRLPGDAPGVFTCCLTTQAAQNTPPDVVIGSYDLAKGTFTPTNQADALNTTGRDAGLSLEPRFGRYAVLGRGTTGPSQYLFAARKAPGLPFPPAVPITGMPSPTYGMALGYVSGQLKLFFSPPPYTSAVMQDLDITNLAAPTLTGSPQVVARPLVATNVLLAVPITGRDGDVEGLLISEGNLSSQSSGVVFQDGLDPTRPGRVLVAGCGSNCSVTPPTAAGGRLLFATGVPQQAPVIQDVEVAWLLGDVVAVGGTADVSGAVSSGPKATTLVFASGGVRPPILLPSPFDVGRFALDLATLLALGTFAHPDASQLGGMSFPIPNDTRLRGLDVALQGLTFDPSSAPLAWTNTALLSVR